MLQCDVVQFFPAVDHAILRGQLARHIACPDTLGLMDRILASGQGVLDRHYDMVYFPGDDLLAAGRPRGLPIGNLTSQNWANVYLDELDQFVKHELRCVAYLRYADDFLLFGDDKATLWAWRSGDHRPAGRAAPPPARGPGAGLPGHGRHPLAGLPRLSDAHPPLKRHNVKAFGRRLRAQRDAYHAGQITPDEIRASLKAWIAHAKHADTYQLRRGLMRQVVFRAPGALTRASKNQAPGPEELLL